jgi:RHS repeat-associated protein
MLALVCRERNSTPRWSRSWHLGDGSDPSYYRAIYYDPLPGRFVSEDPIKFSGGLNFYSYVRSAPTDMKDSFGLCPTQACPDYIKNFFQTLMPVFRHMADQTGANPKYFAALSSYESGWLGNHAQGLHNPFGLTNAGNK